jgi:hypothetical protein
MAAPTWDDLKMHHLPLNMFFQAAIPLTLADKRDIFLDIVFL